jgi:hypothetical protein
MRHGTMDDDTCSTSAGYYSDRNAGNAIKELEVRASPALSWSSSCCMLASPAHEHAHAALTYRALNSWRVPSDLSNIIVQPNR